MFPLASIGFKSGLVLDEFRASCGKKRLKPCRKLALNEKKNIHAPKPI